MAERKDYRADRSPQDGQWYVFAGSNERVAGPFPRREEALADARDRAGHNDGPSSVEGEDIATQADYGDPSPDRGR